MTRIEGRKDDDLLLQKGGRGFPHIAFMDEEGGIVAVADPRDRTVKGFEKALKGEAQRFLDLRAKAKAGDSAAQVDLALLEGSLGRIGYDDVRKRLEGKTLTDAQKASLGDLELGALVDALQGAKDDATAKAAAKSVADAFAKGRMPAGAELKGEYLGIVLGYAFREEDPDLATKALDAITPVYEEMAGKDNPRLQQWLRETKDKIAEMRAAKEPPASDEGMEEGSGDGGAK